MIYKLRGRLWHPTLRLLLLIMMATDSTTEEYYYGEIDCESKEFPHRSWILPTLYSLFFLVGLTGNVVVIAVVSKRSSRRADTFILNLAVSDLMFVLTLPFWTFSKAQGDYWSFGVFLCKASTFVIAITRCSGCLLMAIMSVDRYLAVIKGRKVHPLRTRCVSVGACCVIWAVSISVSCPLLVTRDLIDCSCKDQEMSFLPAFKMAIIFLTFVFPFIIVTFCYCRMAKYLWNHFGSQINAMKSKGKPRRGHRWLLIVTCVVGVYCVSWLPFNTFNTLLIIDELGIEMSRSTKVVITEGLHATAPLAFANSCTNPLIYAFLDRGFRRRAQLAMPRVFLSCRSLLPISGSTPETTTSNVERTSTYTDNR